MVIDLLTCIPDVKRSEHLKNLNSEHPSSDGSEICFPHSMKLSRPRKRLWVLVCDNWV